MKFRVLSREGRGLCTYHSGIPYEYLESMVSAGCKFQLDGQPISKDAVLKMAKAASKPDTTPTKGIRCVDTGEIYHTQAAAARALGIDPAAVSESVKLHKRRSGYLFEKVG